MNFLDCDVSSASRSKSDAAPTESVTAGAARTASAGGKSGWPELYRSWNHSARSGKMSSIFPKPERRQGKSCSPEGWPGMINGVHCRPSEPSARAFLLPPSRRARASGFQRRFAASFREHHAIPGPSGRSIVLDDSETRLAIR